MEVWNVYGKYGVFMGSMECLSRSQRPSDLRRGSVAVHLLQLRVRIPSVVSVVGLIPRPEGCTECACVCMSLNVIKCNNTTPVIGKKRSDQKHAL
jgi:hypothetical protein